MIFLNLSSLDRHVESYKSFYIQIIYKTIDDTLIIFKIKRNISIIDKQNIFIKHIRLYLYNKVARRVTYADEIKFIHLNFYPTNPKKIK